MGSAVSSLPPPNQRMQCVQGVQLANTLAVQDRALSLQLFSRVIKDKGGDRATATDFCRNIMRETHGHGCSGSELAHGVFLNDNSTCYPNGRPAGPIGHVDVMVSYSWSYNIKELCYAIINMIKDSDYLNEGVTNKYGYDYTLMKVWLDVMSVNQHSKQIATELSQMEQVIANSSFGTVLYLGDDGVPLTRVWCVWEIFKTVQLQRPLIVSMAQFSDAVCPCMAVDHSFMIQIGCYDMLDVRNANATVASDRDAILQELETTVGADVVNSTVLQAVKAQTYTFLVRYIRKRGGDQKAQLEAFCQKQQIDPSQAPELIVNHWITCLLGAAARAGGPQYLRARLEATEGCNGINLYRLISHTFARNAYAPATNTVFGQWDYNFIGLLQANQLL